MRREDGEVDEGLSQEGPGKVGKVVCSESNDRFKVSCFYLGFRKQPELENGLVRGGGWGSGVENRHVENTHLQGNS